MIISTLENGVITKSLNNVEFDFSCDVLCVGAGAGGVYAAVGAAQEGADTILLEISSNIGGMHVCGSVTDYYFGSRGGSHEEEREKHEKDTIFFLKGAQYEQRQLHITDKLHRSGVKTLCKHSATGVLMDENRVIGLRVFNGEKEINIGAKMVIDATSDGHIIRMIDVKKQYGRPINNLNVPFTVRAQYIRNGHIYSDNTDSGYTDQYDSADFSKKVIFAHANSARHVKNEQFMGVALNTGIREGLTFEGEEKISYEDIVYGRVPEKTLFWAYSDLDRHGYDRALDEELFQNWWVISNLATIAIRIPVPMGAVVPKGIKGIVTAGRCHCCDTYSQSAVRMNRDMFRMGECVGHGCAMAVKQNKDFLDIDYPEYLEKVTALGCYSGYSDRTFGFEGNEKSYIYRQTVLGNAVDFDPDADNPFYMPVTFDVEENIHLLKTKIPGVAIWSCYLEKENQELKDKLFAEMQGAEDELYKYNCAITLGLMEDKRALPVLREIVENRDCFYFLDGRRSNQFRTSVAICLIGRLGDEDDYVGLKALLSDGEYEKEMYHTLKPDYAYCSATDKNIVYFDVITHTCMALYKLCIRLSLDKNELHSDFISLFENDKFLKRATTAIPESSNHTEVVKFAEHVLRITSDNQ